MVDEDGEVLTIITGGDAKKEETSKIEQFASTTFKDLEIDVVEGGQPLYSYIFSVE